MAPFISIIMPVYNVERYIENSIKTVLGQTFGDFELILVDDCSPDNSGKICDRFAETDKRIRVLHLEKNGGVAKARNRAMQEVNGKYLCFLDSDDYFDSDMLQRLYESVAENPAQAVIFGLVEEYLDSGRLVGTKTVAPRNKILRDRKQLREELLYLEADDLYGYPCNKMYSVEYLKKCKAVFPDMKFNEDIIFNIDFFNDAETCNTIDFAPYHYIKHTGSKTGSFIPTYYEDIMVKIDRLYSQLVYWGMDNRENLCFLASRYTRYLFSALERNCDKRAGMSREDRRDFFLNVVRSDRFMKLSPYLSGTGITGIMAKALKTENAFLCLMIAGVISAVKRYLPGVFKKIS